MSDVNAAIARGLLGWKTLADMGQEGPWATTTWVDPLIGISHLQDYCSSIENAWPLLQIVRERGHQEKFMSVMQDMAKELGIKYDPAFPMFYSDANLICQALVKLYGLG